MPGIVETSILRPLLRQQHPSRDERPSRSLDPTVARIAGPSLKTRTKPSDSRPPSGRGPRTHVAIALVAGAIALGVLGYEVLWRPEVWAATPRLAAVGEQLVHDGARAVFVLLRGEPVLAAYAPRDSRTERLPGASLAKVLTGTTSLLLAAQEGVIDLEDPAWKFIPQWQTDPLKSQIAIRHLASNCSGLPHRLSPSAPELEWQHAFWTRKPDAFERLLAEAPVLFEPGTRYLYSGPAFAALGYAVTASLQSTDLKDIKTLLDRRLIRPLGIPSEEWRIGYGRSFEANGLTLYETWSGSSFSARATAAIGQLFLQEGTWEGEIVLDAALVRESATYRGTPVPRDEPDLLPALGWWSNEHGAIPSLPRDAYFGAGSGHQVLVVVPSLSLVLTRYGSTLGADAWDGAFWHSLDRQLLAPILEALAGEGLIAENRPDGRRSSS